MKIDLKKISVFLTELIYPPRCLGCDVLLTQQEKKVGFCKSCRKRVRLVGANNCDKCGRPLADSNEQYCSTCQKTTHTFYRGMGVFQYDGPLKLTMYRLKYSNKRCYCRVLARYVNMTWGDYIRKEGIEAIIPVPMYKKKEKKRGYNQAAEIAKAVGLELNLPVYLDLVYRIVDTKPMKGLDSVKRKENIQNAFKLSDNSVQLNKVLIIDDIYTIGSTMDALGTVLKKRGIPYVYCMSICIGKRC